LIGALSVLFFWTPISQAVRGLMFPATADGNRIPAIQPTNGPPVDPQTETAQALASLATATDTLLPSDTPTITLTETISSTATQLGGGNGQLAFVSTRTGVPQVFLINADGSNPVQITNMPDGACQPDWKSDGLSLVFISPCEKRQDVYSNAKIYTINVDGSGLTQLPIPEGGFEPAWSPDGQRIAFSAKLSGAYQIYLFHLTDNAITLLTEKTSDSSLPDWSRYPAWSRSGTQIVYSGHSQLTGALQIWVMSDAGRGKTRLVLNDVKFWDFQPTWDFDGRTIYFSETTGAQALGWLMQFDYENRSDPDAIQVPNSNYATDVSISPDLNWLAFESTDDGVVYTIELMTRDGKNRAALTNDPAQEFDPVWRPLFLP
jgi:Tol biopolymer transport system component